jgi:4-amino-4-deoxy-L-arabinose transferase-like glycosyltransferase
MTAEGDAPPRGRGEPRLAGRMTAEGDAPPRARGRALGFLLLLCLGLRVVGLARPCLSDDEATYCVVAREMLSGHVLYRDVVDHKPPLIYVTYAATQALGGPRNGMRLLHLLTAMVVFATALLLGRIARRVWGRACVPGVRFWAALLYVVFTTTLLDFDAQAANCELFMMLPLTASVALYLDGVTGRLRPGLLAAAGALVGVAMLYKYQAAVQLPLYALHLAWCARRRPSLVAEQNPGRVPHLPRGAAAAEPPSPNAIVGAVALGAGLAAALAGAVGVMHVAGAWQSAWFWFRFNFAYIKEGLRPAELAARAAKRVSYGVLPAAFIWVLGGAAALRALRSRGAADDPERLDRFAAGWLVVSALAVTAGGRFFGHYFHQVAAPLAVLAAPAAVRLWSSRRGLVLAAIGIPAAVFFVLGLGHGRMMAAAGVPDPDYPAMAAAIAARSDPRDPLVVWGNAPVLYFEAERPLGSRFVFSNYLTGLSPATRTQSDPRADASANVVAESWDMFEADLAARRPRLFVDTSPGNIGAYGKFPPARYPRLRAILDRDYVPIANVAGARIYTRRTP